MAVVAVVLATAVTGAALSACSDGDGSASPTTSTSTTVGRRPNPATTTTTVPGAVFAAGVRQFRSDEVAKVMHVELENLTDQPIHVTSVQLAWPGLAEAPPSSPDYTAHPGVVVAFQMDYGAGICPPPGSPPTPTEGAIVRVRGISADGSPVTSDVVVTRTLDTLTRIQAVQCDNQRVASVVDIALSGPWVEATTEADRPALVGSVVVTPVPGLAERVVLDRIEGAGVLVDLETVPPGRTPMAVVEPGGGTVDVAVAVVASARCDGHALGEDKKTFDMYATVDLGGRHHYADLSFAEPDRPAVRRVIERTCAEVAGR